VQQLTSSSAVRGIYLIILEEQLCTSTTLVTSSSLHNISNISVFISYQQTTVLCSATAAVSSSAVQQR